MTAETKLIKARTGDEMLAALAEGMGGGDAPTLEELAAWWPDCPDADRKEANKRLAALFVGRFRMTTDPPFVAESAQWSSTAAAVNVVMVQAHPVEDLSSVTIDNSNGDSVELLPDLAAPVEIRRRLTLTAFPVVHRVWRAEARAAVRVARSTDATPPKAPHPLAPIVRAWAAQPTAVAPYPVRRRASLPNPTRDPGPLPDFASRDAPDPPEQTTLFDDLPGTANTTAPHWILALYERSGGAISQGGRLPLAISLVIGAMVRLPVERRTGNWHKLRFPHRIEHEGMEGAPWLPGTPAVERWLWPDGWGNRYRNAHQIRTALRATHRQLGWHYFPGVGDVLMLSPSVIPRTRTDPMVEFTIRIPKRAAHGGQLDWPRFARYAVESATLARAYLSATAHMHRSAHKGHPITREIAAPLLGPDGKPRRRKGGALIRSPTATEPNPSAQFVRRITDRDLALMIGHSPQKARGRWQRQRAREAFERLAADGVIDLHREGTGFHIFGPDGKP